VLQVRAGQPRPGQRVRLSDDVPQQRVRLRVHEAGAGEHGPRSALASEVIYGNNYGKRTLDKSYLAARPRPAACR
jgi:hypothetical protein